MDLQKEEVFELRIPSEDLTENLYSAEPYEYLGQRNQDIPKSIQKFKTKNLQRMGIDLSKEAKNYEAITIVDQETPT